ncbi:MAG: hypothetical protein ACFB01_05370 [Cohaesibacteraceae bacterium]
MTFDGITIAYYAAICGILAAFAPRVRTMMQRLIVGAGIGIVAATLFPTLRAAVGF